ncbi:hypothetical protein IQ22_02112 [Pseudomonas duriflava]|uniref:Uncharacterized protein n=1 Tax=Pseudomonas duriflava TaxID=459528 RepID=A0A562QC09_9PSED|nr:hypothetical protein [Pseudomonas duriflava]TWI54249.1 hypothetical protein IQ22_02112 [Pseudomonas duriflava]
MGRHQPRRLAKLPFERLQQRLERALDEAATAELLYREVIDEVEIDGLHLADLDIIKAWLIRNDYWVQGNQELIYPRPLPSAEALQAVRCLRCGLRVNEGKALRGCTHCAAHQSSCLTDSCFF